MDQLAAPTQYRFLIAQSLLVILGVTLLALAPPARGSMVALPLIASQRADGIAEILASGALIVRAGPVDGSLVLQADRDTIAPTALRHGILLLPTSLLGCSIAGISA